MSVVLRRTPSGRSGPGVSTTVLRSRVQARSTVRWALGIAIVGTIAIRLGVALLVTTPRYYRDEFLYAEVGRSLSHLGAPLVLGQSVGLYSFLSSLINAPVWLISNVHIAFHLAQTEAVVAFALAGLPAHALARRVGLGPRGSLAAAIAALLVPDGVFTGTLMTEPYAYPLFLATLVVAIDALANPSKRRQVGLLAMIALLCFARAQFVVVPLAILIAAPLAASRGHRLSALLSQRLLILAAVGASAVVAVLGPAHVTILYGGLAHEHLDGLALLRAGALACVVLALAAGWVVVPGACVGLSALLGGDARQRSFAALTLVLVPALLLEATIFGAGENVVVERYVFYVAPLLAIGFLVAAREQLLRSRLHLVVGAALAVVAFALPAAGFFAVNVDQSPVLFGLRPLESALGWPGQGAVVTLLVLLALAATVLGRRQRHTALAAVGAALLVGTSAAASVAVVNKAQRTVVPEFHLTSPTTLVIFSGEKSSDVMKELFWNPRLDQVLAVGTDTDSRRYPALAASVDRVGRLEASNGEPLHGAVVIDGSARTAWVTGPGVERHGLWTFVRDAGAARVALLATGWRQGSAHLGITGRFDVWPSTRAVHGEQLILALRAPAGRLQTMTFRCGPRVLRRDIGQAPVHVALQLGGAVSSCWFGLTGGAPSGPQDDLSSVDVLSARLLSRN